MPHEGEVQPGLHTRAGQVDGESRSIGDLQTPNVKCKVYHESGS